MSHPHPTAWYRKSGAQALSEQGTTLEAGLEPDEVLRRRSATGTNVIPSAERKSPWRILASQFTDFMVVVLLAAAAVSGVLGEPEDIVAILAIILLNGILGFVQEFRAERAMEALKELAAPHAKVRRRGETLFIPAYELVPGDVVLLEAGNLVPADLRLLESVELQVDESALTGESVAARKTSEPIEIEQLPVADQKNMAFKGTLLTAGRGTGIVIGTGMNTELGRIAKLLREEVEVKTPLQNRLDRFSRRLALVVLALCGILFGVGVARGENTTLMFLTAVSLAVAAIPEALPAVVTVSLALGARRMAKRNALIRRLPAVEALGSVTYACSDKTGTLTENRMRARGFHVDGKFSELIPLPVAPSPSDAGPWPMLLRMLAQNNDAMISDRGALYGDPTETALLEAALLAGFDKREWDLRHPRVAEIPFSSERALMTTVHDDGSCRLALIKGAPERVLAACSRKLLSVGTDVFDASTEKAAAEKMAAQGLRVLAFAFRRLSGGTPVIDLETLESDLTFVGLVGLIDPPRKEAMEAIALCKSAGIRVMMITGDHPTTAKSIARQLGIATGDHAEVMTGQHLLRIGEEELKNVIRGVSVFARVAPEQKIRIVKALQADGEIVAMTGDGVNDAPALRRADIGVSMGKGGTDVAREASHMVLLDDNFATIVASVREGRRIYDNIRKFVRFALSGNSGEIWTLFLAPFLGLPVPLLPVQILWVNLVTDGLPGLALAVEGEEKQIMQRPPRRPTESVFAHGLWQHVLWVGLLTAGTTLLTMAWALRNGSPRWQSMAFTVLTFVQMGHVLAIRSERDSLFRIGLFSNLPLLGAVALTFALQLCLLYIPALNSIFRTEPLTTRELAVCVIVSLSVFVAVEIEKWAKRRSRRS